MWVQPGSGRPPGGENGNPTLVLLPGESHRQRSLLGYSPWGRRARHDWASERTHFSWELREGKVCVVFIFTGLLPKTHSKPQKKIIGRRKERRKEGREVKEGIEGGRKECKLIWGQRKQGFSLNTPASFPATLSFSSHCLAHPTGAPKLGSTFSIFPIFSYLILLSGKGPRPVI